MDPKFLMRTGLASIPAIPKRRFRALIGALEDHAARWFPVSFFFLGLGASVDSFFQRIPLTRFRDSQAPFARLIGIFEVTFS